MLSIYTAKALRSAPTFHAVTRWDNLRGAGSVPRLTIRQTVAAEQPTSAWTTGCRTFAESGSKSKFLRASGIVLVSVCCGMLCAFVSRDAAHDSHIKMFNQPRCWHGVQGTGRRYSVPAGGNFLASAMYLAIVRCATSGNSFCSTSAANSFDLSAPMFLLQYAII